MTEDAEKTGRAGVHLDEPKFTWTVKLGPLGPPFAQFRRVDKMPPNHFLL